MTLRIGSLFSGVGGLDMAVRDVLGGEVAWFSEYEPPTAKTPKPTQAAARVLAYRYPDVPNLGDITVVDWSQVAPVDVLTGGFPCTDVSAAGKRLGMKPGTRSGLWSHMAYAVSQLRPRLVVIENVRGLLSSDAERAAGDAGTSCDLELCPWCMGDDEGRPLRALGCVLADLAELGYDARWCGLRASDIGAPHSRYRVVILAWPAADTDSIGSTRPGAARNGWCGSPHHDLAPADSGEAGRHSGVRLGRSAGQSAQRDDSSTPADPDCNTPESLAECVGATLTEQPSADIATHSEGDGRDERWTEPAGIVGGPDVALGDSATAWGVYRPAIQRWERILGRPAPAPTKPGRRGGQRLSPVFVEWMMGLPQGWVTDVPSLTDSEMLGRLGNGVVPQQIEAALRFMLTERGWVM